MKAHTRYDDIVPFVTRDGSLVRELMHPSHHAVMHQSLAEAVVEPGRRTLRHRHRVTEEIYHVTRGRGRMHLGNTRFDVAPGDTVCIAPGIAHCIENTGDEPLHILCTCTPPYSHDDTELLEAPPAAPQAPAR